MKIILKDKSEYNILYFRYFTDFINDIPSNDVNSKYIFEMDLANITDIQSYVKTIETNFTTDNLSSIQVVDDEGNNLTNLFLHRITFLRFNGNASGLTIDLTIE